MGAISRVLLVVSLLVAVSGCGLETLPADSSLPSPRPETSHSLRSRLGTVERDITYGKVDGVSLKMDIYYPNTALEATPAVVYVHGGGWTSGDKGSGAGTVDTPELRSRGYLVAAINYRLAPEHKFPAQIEDVKCAVRFLRANASAYGIDPSRIGAWGGSAGGHLVALLGVTESNADFEGEGGHPQESSQVRAVVDLFGPTDLTVAFGPSSKLSEVFGTSDPRSEKAARASPVTWVTKDAPPFLIIHGDKDAVVPLAQSQRLYERLVSAGVPASLVVVVNGGHGFSPSGGRISPSRNEISKMIAEFFDRYLK